MLRNFNVCVLQRYMAKRSLKMAKVIVERQRQAMAYNERHDGKFAPDRSLLNHRAIENN